jgi:pimeloyl-ACP methyl ester carboxylesterase
MTRHLPLPLRALVAGAAAMAVVAAAVPATAVPASPPAPGAAAAGHPPQRLVWTGCRRDASDEVGEALDRAGARCSTVRVPLDYSHPSGRTIEVALSRLGASDTDRRIGVMLLNGGGPGGGSLDLPPDIRTLMGKTGGRYDLIGMDPRSSGRSAPVDCHWPTSTWMRSPGADRADFDRVTAFERALAARCLDSGTGLLPHISTRNTARDMDVVRAALGERRISYYGVSYGTYLGSVYAQMFPDRVDRMVLDSAVDPAHYGGEDLLDFSGPDNERALREWAAWAARHDGAYHLGGTREAVLATVRRVLAAAAERPLRVGGRPVDAHVLPFVLFNALDDDRDPASASLAEAVRVLREAAEGRGAEPTEELRDTLDFLLTGVESAAGGSQVAVLCGDRAVDRDPEAYWRRVRRARAERPLLGPLTASLSPCVFWPAPRERPTAIGNGVPALIVNSTGDTRTPYRGARALHRVLTGSRLLTLEGARIHAVYPRYGNACVDDTVNAYFRTGHLPPTDLTCAPDSTVPTVTAPARD